jgi:hypothetical protein
MENKPRISKWILGGYLILALIIAGIFITLALAIHFKSTAGFEWFCLLAIVITGLLCAVPYNLYKTRYTINNTKLSSKSIFAFININTKDIAKIEQTRIPLMFKGFGASIHSGWFYIPAVGWTKVIITNLTDGVLIKTKDGGNYLITPSNPSGFVKLLK